MRMHFTDKRALALTVCWVAALALTGSTDALLFMAPALLIAIPLLGGRFFGEELIVRLAARRARPRRCSEVAAPLSPPTSSVWLPRGARLIATSLAKRPPPALLLPQN
ncbi:MAG TPA: hypothetical protein VFX85_04085 [Solirubrobacterales bacterium]|nr:hypothetical protein [Solirubrobacterales bacterium]